ncbi:LysR family transcriptional regulator [Pseudosulfitobacter pseudonitzschiae]|nr:LysR family transcriptional regulator [Pseudosulfitobacter pseudonitzschiae]UFE45033.1 LysR family transcriptional regulator [Pseudosulfitobacter pseudonitzschiae]UFE87895.1 LysR family transcriptional regulator [Pseudosulfitobacter pseudonitzschiae]UFF15384.1 LysR family transcriptional regulator [Pseudosulfitobacter pseudonitzschiae]UFF39271.1 LysR family transcriptional regulator [Pseudosulfitobacter pseudonitzschiae]UFF62610.1 LysR family transcriptional regulator [Pseudosulfitobacter p
MTRLSMRQLLLISAIDDNGSLKRASELIGMSQPRATKALQEAEEITGTKLFNRTNRGLNPTHAGESMIRHAKTILSQLKEMEEELRTASDSGWAKLRIGTIMGAVPYLTETISTYLRRFPRTSFEILEDTSVELFRQLDRGMLDLIIGRSSMIATPQLYHVTAFHDERLAVVANPAHPLIGRTRVRLTDLEDARWIVYTAAMPMRLLLEQEFRQAGLGMPRGLMETRSALTTISLIQADPNTVALLSSDVAAFFVNFGMASVLPMHLRSKSEPYELITRRSVELPPHALAFIEDLVAGATTRL